MNSKEALRARFRRVRAGIPPEERERAKSEIESVLSARFPAQSSRTVALFASFSDEFPTDALIEGFRAQGRRVLLPRVGARGSGRAREMALCEFGSLDDLAHDRFGIRSPDGLEWGGAVDLIVLPGLAFGRDGSRLGYGGGFYDRLLERERYEVSTLVGLAFDEQIVASLPVAKHDVLVHHVATPTHVIDCVVRR